MADTKNIQQSRQNKSASKKPKRNFFLRALLILIFAGCVCFLCGVGLFWYYAKDAPALKESKLEDTRSSKVYDVKGNLILELGEKKRSTITPTEIPQQLKDAITSIEDKRFYKHIGVDPIRILGATLSNVRGGNLQGGSTLTQQLIKLSYFSTKEQDQTIKRKAQEAWLSIQLERKKSKDEILTYYINKVYMSNGLYGMETAAETYYNKKLGQLSLAQTALIAGMPQAPSDYDPTLKDAKKQKATKERRDTVLSEMYKDKKITKTEYDKAINTPITDGVVEQKTTSDSRKVVDNYLKEVIAEVQKKTKKNPYTDGMNIYTNIDMDAQNYLYNLVNSSEYINFPSDNFQTAVTMMDVKTGQVRAQIGSRKVADGVLLGDNLATSSVRDAGSTVKPITDYGPAIEYLNYSTGTTVYDGPYKFEGTDISVNNYDHAYKGTMTIRNALIDSRNVPAAKTLMAVGLDKSSEFLKGLGITYKDGLQKSSAIQGALSSLKLTAAYSAFANGGTYYTPYYVNKVVYPNGQEEDFEPKGVRAMKESTAYMITDMLKDVIAEGTGRNAQIAGLIQAGKTGTSNYTDDVQIIGDQNGSPDSTFVGYTTNYAIGVWTGNKNYNESISSADSKISSSIYRYMMSHISQNLETQDWTQPDSVTKYGSELYVKGHVPVTSSSTSYYYSSTQEPTYTTQSTTIEPTTTSSSTETTTETTTTPAETSSSTAEQTSESTTPTTSGH
ncbi:PBP1A family penicillin-binding protein [Vagococcus entomophilus]|uniref:Penicillin-binding protein n=1 Tax=Vagococcus entomophilus TaxID=1160095 RepID=A0A430AJ63_9ENTE|nr:PBP1A family penicillin-binding protein [Vagococcus entomophilus]RSU08156.1 penicillin-binding protein [Vagococcus entomophilus]